jgi:hypothetical protein
MMHGQKNIKIYAGCYSKGMPYFWGAFLGLNYMNIINTYLCHKLNCYGDNEEKSF